ncbi:MAG: UDP-N-acetylglucosamine 1-carboxyvinyltransferase, partial [Candidatus Portnoybacteria bacterium CG_4_8_14_3_um_filter_44_15]|uniref:UDP-N-acetylglucosamine 1-carboxyvinyltransferase n=3 Tax=Candidatus Portnoyibacteriota TaxID=1817913 RepID=A0A2M7YM65_9BACT
MEKFVIRGDKPLQGEIRVNGAKNSALKILAAALLTDDDCRISNVPQIEDIFRLLELLEDIGVKVKNGSRGEYLLNARGIKKSSLSPSIAQKLKGSILMTAPLLARYGRADFPQPGGCVIGQRPRDIFIDGFKAFGASVRETAKGYSLSAKKITGTKFVFPLVSVTATETMILLAVLAKGKTNLVNAACEPEIIALADFLNKMGAKIKGAGTPFMEIEGISHLAGGECEIMPDRIEGGSFAVLGAAANSPIKITGINPGHLEVLWFLLAKAGANFELGKDFVKIKPSQGLKAVGLKTHEYPGFPTDLQAPFVVLMTQASGLSLIHETIFEGRLFYADVLNQMGAKIIMCDPHRVVVQGPAKLSGRHLISPDIRAGIAMVIAALIAKGESVIENIYQIDRGYERIEERLQKLGADIKRINS